MSRHSNVVVGSRRVVFDARRVICSWYNEVMASFHVCSRVTFAVEANARIGVVSTSDVLSCCSGIWLYTSIYSNLDCCSGWLLVALGSIVLKVSDLVVSSMCACSTIVLRGSVVYRESTIQWRRIERSLRQFLGYGCSLRWLELELGEFEHYRVFMCLRSTFFKWDEVGVIGVNICPTMKYVWSCSDTWWYSCTMLSNSRSEYICVCRYVSEWYSCVDFVWV